MAEVPLLPALASSICAFLALFYAALSVGPAWDAMARRRVAAVVPRLEALGFDDRQIACYLRWWGVALFGTFTAVGVLLGMLPVAVGLVYLVYVAPVLILDYIVKRRSLLMRDQVVRAAAGLANSARAGLSLAQGLEKVCAETPQPMGQQLRRIVQEYKSGRPLTEALTETRKRLDLEAFTMFSSAITVCLERGGKITFALDRIAQSLHETQRLERKLETDTASGRRQALVLGMFPVAFLVLFSVLDPDGMANLYNTLPGQFVLLGVGVMVYIAFRLSMWILDVDL